MIGFKRLGMTQYHGGHGGYGPYGGGDGGIGMMAMMVIVLTIIIFWLLVKGANLVVRALASEGEGKKAVWIAFSLWLGTGLALVVSGLIVNAHAQSAGTVTGIASGILGGLGIALAVFTGLLLMISRAVLAENQETFSKPRERLTTAVLKRGWWQPIHEFQ